LKILKNYVAPKADLIKFYKTVIRPVLEYSNVLWAGGLTAKQRINIERVEKRALQIICPGEKYENTLLSNEITRLEERRRDHCINLVSDLSKEEHKLHHLLPPRKCQIITRNTISNKYIFYNFNSRTNRFKLRPFPYAVDTFNSSNNG
jgi:hypothetical protein